MRRRSLLRGVPALLAPGLARAQARWVALRELGRRAGLSIGSSSEIDLARDPAYAALIDGNAGLFAPNMSWQRMSPTPDEAFAGLDPNIEAARRAGLRLTGYHLLWHQRLPGWFGGLDRAAAERAITRHAESIGTRFGRDSQAWNVVNEAIRPADGVPGGLRRSPLLDKFGAGYFEIAFNAAKLVQPGVLRMYNDYDLELDMPDQQARRRALLGLLDYLASRTVPIQAVGLQSHLRTRSFDRFDAGVYRRFLDQLAARGLDIYITELDVQDWTPGDVATRDARVADIYRRFLEAALAQPRVKAVVFWGLSDRHSWLNDPSRPQDARADGLPGRPAPFDAELRPKQAYDAVARALAGAPRR